MLELGSPRKDPTPSPHPTHTICVSGCWGVAGQGKYGSFSGKNERCVSFFIWIFIGRGCSEEYLVTMQDDYRGGDKAASELKQGEGLRGLPPFGMHIYSPGDWKIPNSWGAKITYGMKRSGVQEKGLCRPQDQRLWQGWRISVTNDQRWPESVRKKWFWLRWRGHRSWHLPREWGTLGTREDLYERLSCCPL